MTQTQARPPAVAGPAVKATPPGQAGDAPAGGDQPVMFAGQRHLLDVDTLSPAEVTSILESAEGMAEVLSRDVRKTPALRGKTVITLFYEASTRTRVSFEQAGKVLGADVINVTADSSSVKKGESLLNTALTLRAMHVDAIVMRHPHSGAPYFVADHVDASVINAGDGTHAHPTQALVDLYTIRRHFGRLSGLRVAIIGDILYSRVVRSDMHGLRKMGAEVVVCGPRTLLPPGFAPGETVPEGLPFQGVRVAASADEAVEGADVVMALRIQSERQSAGHLPDLREYSARWGVNSRRLSLANPGALLMHPGPMNEGIEVSSDVAHGAQSVVEEQVANGVAVRMAVLYALVAGKREIGQ